MSPEVFGRTDVLCAAWALSIVFCLTGSRRQFRQGGDQRSFRRWLGVSVVCGSLAILPWLTAVVLIRARPGLESDRVIVVGIVAALAVLMTIVNRSLHPFVWSTGQDLPRFEDDKIPSRVATLADELGVTRPIVLEVRGGLGVVGVAGWISGLTTPALILSDAVRLEFRPDERDALIASRLAHFATRTLWWQMVPWSVAGVSAVLIACVLYRRVPLPGDQALNVLTIPMFAWVFMATLRAVLSRTCELRALRRSGRLIGYANVATRFVARYPLPPARDEGLSSWLFRAFWDYPSSEEQIVALDRWAPEDARVEMANPVVSAVARRRVWGARGVLLLRVTVLAVAGLMITSGRRRALAGAVVLLGGIAFLPWLLQILSRRQEVRLQRERNRTPSRWRNDQLILVALVVVVLQLVGIFWLGESIERLFPAVKTLFHPVIPAILLLLAVLLLFALLVTMVWNSTVERTSRLEAQSGVLLVEGRIAELQELVASHPREVAESSHLRINAAIAQAILGDVPGAISNFERFVESGDAPPSALFSLYALYLEAERPADALIAARQYGDLVPDDPIAAVLAAGALCDLGRPDDAESELDSRDLLVSDLPHVTFVLVRIALARGDLELAKAFIDRGERLAPGDVAVSIARLRLALQAGDREEAAKWLQALRVGVAAAPRYLMQRRTEAFARQVSQMRAVAQSPTVDSPGSGE